MTREQWLDEMRQRYRRAMKRGDATTAKAVAEIARKPPVIIPDITEIGYVQDGTIYLKSGAAINYRETYFEFEQLSALVRLWREQDALRAELHRRQMENELLLSGYLTGAA
ncbi:hypothetical protein MASR2M18_21770 [Ignavibacteria bacterium]